MTTLSPLASPAEAHPSTSVSVLLLLFWALCGSPPSSVCEVGILVWVLCGRLAQCLLSNDFSFGDCCVVWLFVPFGPMAVWLLIL